MDIHSLERITDFVYTVLGGHTNYVFIIINRNLYPLSLPRVRKKCFPCCLNGTRLTEMCEYYRVVKNTRDGKAKKD